MGASLVQPIYALTPSYTVGSQYKKSKYYDRLLAVELSGDHRRDVIEVALSQLGYHEGNSESEMGGENRFGYRNFTEYNRIAGAPLDNGEGNGVSYGFEWCAAFVSWCQRQAGVPKSVVITEVSCQRLVDWLKGKNAYKSRSSGYEPKTADLIFFRASSSSSRAGHVGLVVGSDGEYIYTVEGNNGERVNYHKYKKTNSMILGYGTPAYTVDTDVKYNFELKEGYIEPGVYVTTEDLNIRTGMGTSYSSLGKIPKGTALEITEAVGDWARVSYGEKSGWCSIDYLKLSGSIKYTVTYSAEDATSVPPSTKKEHGTSISVSGIIPERAGHEFLGWSRKKDGSSVEFRAGDAISENQSITLYAVWRYVGYTLNFYSESGELIASQRYDLGDSVKVPEPPKKEGGLLYRYEFSGWSPSLPEKVSGDANFTATYEKISIFETTEKEEESETAPEMSAPNGESTEEPWDSVTENETQKEPEADTTDPEPEESVPQTEAETDASSEPEEKTQKPAGIASLAAAVAALISTLAAAVLIRKKN